MSRNLPIFTDGGNVSYRQIPPITMLSGASSGAKFACEKSSVVGAIHLPRWWRGRINGRGVVRHSGRSTGDPHFLNATGSHEDDQPTLRTRCCQITTNLTTILFRLGLAWIYIALPVNNHFNVAGITQVMVRMGDRFATRLGLDAEALVSAHQQYVVALA